MSTQSPLRFKRFLLPILIAALSVPVLYGCNHTNASNNTAPPAQSLPVIAVQAKDVTTYQEFTASMQGSRDIEIRPQVTGTLENIYVDEGTYVHKGQPLFRINAGVYREQYNNASATLQSTKAALENARINVDKLTPLVNNKVVSGVQLEAAKAAYDMAKANVSQAQAQVSSAAINVGYTTITAPADGYIGTIPYKTGSLVGGASLQPLTVLSETKSMHVYFSFSENDFMRFKENYSGNSIEEKIRQLPEVELQLADNSIYPQKGKIEVVKGQFDASMGAIQLRASFPNEQGLLRSGSTGKIRIPKSAASALIVPQEATYELQDKIMVFAVAKDNKVSGRPISVAEKSGSYYVLKGGLEPGERIVFAGLGRLSDGMTINPQPVSMDSLLLAKPL